MPKGVLNEKEKKIPFWKSENQNHDNYDRRNFTGYGVFALHCQRKKVRGKLD
jgi:hypothetical protein